MKIMIASDIHGSAFYCRKLLEAFEREQADRLLLLGDLLYHGPRNALPLEYDPSHVAAMLNQYKDRILCVKGNCDSEVDQMMLEFPILADYALIVYADRLIYVTHGHHFHPQNPPALQPRDILLYGHTHLPDWQTFGQENLALNPGSVSIPKGDSAHSYMILDQGIALWKTLGQTEYHTLKIS